MQENTCCFTGHRHLPANKIEKIVPSLDREIESLIEKGVTDFISGGAAGFDQIAASLIVAKKEMGENIRLIFALPCKNQETKWGEKQQALYHNLLNKTDELIYVSEQYDNFCTKRRNHYMADHSMYCICALLHDKSGTSQTVSYARKQGLQIINVAKSASLVCSYRQLLWWLCPQIPDLSQGTVTKEKFISIVNELEMNFHSKHAGFIDTELLYDEENNVWTMIQHWETKEQLQAASKKMFKDSAAE